MSDEVSAPRVLRVGIINLMPRAEIYEQSLLPPLMAADVAFQPRFVRLESHAYHSSDQGHIAQYQSFSEVCAEGPLDGLIITGAPVEELPYADVVYWSELSEIMDYAEQHVPATLGLCWGAMALAYRLGVDKRDLPHKLFGVLPLENLAPEHPLLEGGGQPLWCPQSRHATLAEDAFEARSAAGVVRSLASSAAAGSTIFESAGGRIVGHLGHPEYEPERLVFEYRRDVAAGRADVSAPEHLDLERPVCTWRPHRLGFFGGWLRSIAGFSL